MFETLFQCHLFLFSKRVIGLLNKDFEHPLKDEFRQKTATLVAAVKKKKIVFRDCKYSVYLTYVALMLILYDEDYFSQTKYRELGLC